MENKNIKCVECDHLKSDHLEISSGNSLMGGGKNVMDNMLQESRCRVEECKCNGFNENGN